MDYGIPKALPVTGAAVIGGFTFTDQLLIVALIGATTFLIALAVRRLWRRNKSIGE